MIHNIDEYVDALLDSNVSAADIDRAASVFAATNEVCRILAARRYPARKRQLP